MHEISLKEALRDYADNERDIKMFQLMLDGHWSQVDSPRVYLASALDTREQIANVITKLGGEVPVEPYSEREQKMLERQQALDQMFAKARDLLETASDELYNGGMSPALLARITEFLYPTHCEG
jgi:hypothetical protein